MDQQTNYIVFLCYGNERVFHECVFALLSLSRIYDRGLPDNMQVWIYTDKPGWFRSFKECPLHLNYRETRLDEIKQWRGTIDFVHRVKIEMLKDFSANKSGNVLYADTDVVFAYPVDDVFQALSAGKRYMHIMEGKISEEGNPIFKKLNAHLKTEATLKLNGKPMYEMAMWNAGVLGFNTKDSGLLDSVLDFTDREYPKFSKHVVEQFAFSVYFSQPGDIKAATPYIIHYWNLKEAGAVLASFFNYFKDKSWVELVRYNTLIQIPALMQEKINFYQGRSVLDKIGKKQWVLHVPDWVELIKQL